MRKFLMFIAIFLTNINIVCADEVSDYIIKMLDSLRTIQQNNNNLHRQDYFDFMKDNIYDVVTNMDVNYDWPLNLNNYDIQFDLLSKTEGTTTNVIKHFVLPSNDTNTIDIIWYDGLPRKGILTFNNAVDTINYFADTITPPLNELIVPFPKITHNDIQWRNIMDCNMQLIDALSGDIVVDTLITGTDSYTIQKVNVSRSGRNIPIERPVFNKDKEDAFIDISSLPSGLYFLVFTDLTTNNVIYVKTLHRGITIIE